VEEFFVKLIRDGEVAVLVSGGFGAGWSTWNYDYPEMLYDAEVAQMLDCVEPDWQAIRKYCQEKYPNAYLGGLDGLYVEWLPQGTAFRIHEYDGSETVEIRDKMNWEIA
jgi:hypothetical protein